MYMYMYILLATSRYLRTLVWSMNMLRWLTSQIRSHTNINGRHNQLTEAWIFLAGVPPCRLSAVPHFVLPLPEEDTRGCSCWVE